MVMRLRFYFGDDVMLVLCNLRRWFNKNIGFCFRFGSWIESNVQNISMLTIYPMYDLRTQRA